MSKSEPEIKRLPGQESSQFLLAEIFGVLEVVTLS